MPIGTGIVYNTGDLILSQVSSSGTAFLETKIAAATSSLIYFDSTARINSASLNSITVGTASYVSGSNSIITNLTASNISASGTSSFGYVGIGTNSPTYKLNVVTTAVSGRQTLTAIDKTSQNFVTFTNPEYSTISSMGLLLRVFPQSDARQGAGIIASGGSFNGDTDLDLFVSSGSIDSTTFSAIKINARGNVGIGTTSPSAKLTIVDNTNGGTINLVGRTSDDTAAINFRATGDGSTYAYVAPDTNEFRLYHNDGFMSFYPGGSEKVRITSTGNVGIGTTIPSVRLHVSGSSILANNISIDPDAYSNTIIAGAISDRVGWGLSSAIGGNAGTGHSWAVGTNGGYLYMGYGNGSSNDSLQEFLMVSGSRNLYLVPVSGNIGVGTFSVYQKLTINGAIETGANGSTTGGPSFYIKYDGASGNYINSIGTEYSSGNTILGYGITGKSSSAGYVSTFANFSGHRGMLMIGAGTLEFKNSRTSLATAVGSDVPMTSSFYIDNSGNVGIGTTTPSAKLNIASTSQTTKAIIQSLSTGNGLGGYLAFNPGGDSTYSKVAIGVYDNYYSSYNRGNIAFMINSAADTTEVGFTDTKMYISASGNVGIGTTSPLERITFGSSDSIIARSSDTSFNSGYCSRILFNQGGTGYGYLGFYTYEGGSGGGERIRIAENGNVGIGTTVPVNKLQVNGNVSGSSFTSSISNAVGFLGTSSWAQNVVSASYATTAQTANALNTGNSYTIAGLTNNGTLSQQGTLSMGSGYQILATTGTAPIPGIAFVGDTNTGIYSPSADTIGFSISGSEKIRIDSNGNVGIGTTSSGGILDVYGATSIFRYDTAGAASLYLRNWTSGGTTQMIFGVASGDDQSTTLSFASNIFSIGNYGDPGSEIRFGTRNSSTADIRVTINQDGNVGIGTTNPGAKLEVQSGSILLRGDGNATFGTYYASAGENTFFTLHSGSGNTFHIGNDVAGTYYSTMTFTAAASSIGGNVGIGTTTINQKLSIYPGTTGGIALQDSGGTTRSYFFIDNTNPTYSTGIRTENYYLDFDSSGGAQNAIRFYTGTGGIGTGTERVRINSSGNVGIGTTSPAAKLEITGSSNSALLNIKSPISGAIVYVSGSGAVGINTSNVGAYTLQVNGSFAATTKSFVIDHPTKAGKRLIYGSLESPYHGIRLTGRDTLVNGKCKVELPEYIYKLILHDSVNIQLTGIKCNKTLYVDEINIPENYFTIAYDKAIFESYKDYDFFWDFTAIRADVPELITEL